MFVKTVVVLVPTWTPPLYILYPATPTLSVDAVQERETLEVVTLVAERFVGTVGGVVSGDTVTVTCAVVDPLAFVAVSVYSVVATGETTADVALYTLPMPLLMLKPVSLLTLHDKTED